MSDSIEIRELRTPADYAACLDLQKATWGPGFTETVPPAILQVAQKVGGIAAGAFDDRKLIGFVFGMTGVENNKLVHWSDMLAVRHEYRNRHIGEQLKWYQRSTLLERGVNRMYWSFDPLDAKNAYLNFCKLGVIAREYVVDMYGTTDSPLHATGTDRLIAIWQLDAERVAAHAANQPVARVPAHESIEIPNDIHALAQRLPERARAWRLRTRQEFTRMLPEFVVTGFVKGEATGRYALTSASNFAA